ncbi:MAG TPA: DEAD/DEAH box helicase [Gammaproteobacteria bacterium]|nr:DEAD/DEAH box helicase [Gammaproteobacteria bacterium]
MIYSYGDLKQAFTRKRIESLESQVESVPVPNILREGEVVSGLAGKKPGSARVYVRVLTTRRGGVEFKSECSCGGRQCRHALLILLAALKTGQASPDAPRAAATPGKARNLRLLYVLELPPGQRVSSEITVRLCSARELASGGFGRLSEFRLSRRLLNRPPAFLRREDVDIAARLTEPLSSPESRIRFSLPDKDDAGLLRDMLASGCCFVGDAQGAPLTLGEARTARHRWRLDRAGDQSYQIDCEPPASRLLLLSEAFYLDPETRQCGPLTLPVPVSVATELREASPVLPEQSGEVGEALARRFPEADLPPLKPLKLKTLKNASPKPRLVIAQEPKTRRPLLTLSFRYGDLEVVDRRGRALRGGTVWRVRRDDGKEDACRRRLVELGAASLHDAMTERYRLSGGERAWRHFLLIDLPRLHGEGWDIHLDPAFGVSIAGATQGWFGDLASGVDNDWFSLDLGIIVDGERVSILPALVSLISTLPERFSRAGLARLDDTAPIHLPLSDGRLAAVPLGRLRRILETLVELYESGALDEAGRLGMSRWQAASLNELDEADGIEWTGEEEILALARRLRAIDDIPAVAPPRGLKAQLRPYQQRGLDWLQFLREYGFGGVLADDMGLGKTLQTLAHVLLEKEQGRLQSPCLIVAPTSLLFNWRREAERFTPDLKILVLHGSGRRERFDDIADADLVITSYGLLLRDDVIHARHCYHLLVLDEAQAIKNPAARVSRAARQLRASHKLCLSGTPMENHLGELWSLFDFLMPGFLGAQTRFKTLFRRPIENEGDEQRGEALSRRVRPYLLRRPKSLVAGELPALTEILRGVPLAETQRELYESIRLAMHRRVREAIDASGVAGSRMAILDALLKLRQVCCDPRLVKLDSAANVRESAKLSLLMTLLPEMVEEGRRILLFSQFTSMLDLIEESLAAERIPWLRLTGQTRDRADVVTRFQQGEAPLFLISLKAGGVGLNLTAADTVIHYDPWWNPAVEDQATARAHRIGQQNPVFVYKLITEGTVEEKIQHMQQRKKALSDALYDGKGNVEPQWTEADLENLFQPLA